MSQRRRIPIIFYALLGIPIGLALNFFEIPIPKIPFDSQFLAFPVIQSREVSIFLGIMVTVVLFLFSLWLGVLVQVVGFAVSGTLVGFKIQMISFGRFSWEGTDRNLRFNLLPKAFAPAMYSGFPEDEINLRSRFALMLLGGIIANLITSGLFIILATQLGRPDTLAMDVTALLRIFSSLMFLTSVVFSICSLIPFPNSSGYKSVGTLLWRILRRHSSVERDLALMTLAGLSKTGIKRRDLPPRLVNRANTLEDGSADFAVARLMKYAVLIDRDEILAAGIALDEATRYFAQVPEMQRSTFWFERAYFVSLHRGQSEEANQCLTEAMKTFVVRPMVRLRAEAAVAFSKQNWQEAKDKARAALEDFGRWGEPVAAREEAEQMQNLFSRAETNLQASMLSGQ